MGCSTQPLPKWFRQELPDPAALAHMRSLLRPARLHTVCESAHCPNLGQCWNRGTATFMILGDTCTRRCRFCAVPAGMPNQVDENEPDEVARAVVDLRLKYVVITSVARDDMPDEGAGHFYRTILAVRKASPGTKIEILAPDFHARRDCWEKVLSARPDVSGHNIETVRRLAKIMRPQGGHDRSLETLALIGKLSPETVVKSGLMVGVGETDAEVLETFDELLSVGCRIVTVGQYLAPSNGERHLKVEKYVTPETFEMYRREGLRKGFNSVMSGPLVRSSYLAEEGFQLSLQNKEGAAA